MLAFGSYVGSNLWIFSVDDLQIDFFLSLFPFYWLNAFIEFFPLVIYSIYLSVRVAIVIFFSLHVCCCCCFFFHVTITSGYFFSLSFSLLQGICPGNRLKIISSYEATCYKASPVSSPSPCPSMPSIYYNNSILSSADSILYENTVGFGPAASPHHHTQHGKRRSWHIMPNKVLYYHYLIYQTFQ